jgi:sugar lactone lactonase YvrE
VLNFNIPYDTIAFDKVVPRRAQWFNHYKGPNPLMAFRKESESRRGADGRPQITEVEPPAAIPGGELQVFGSGLGAEPRPHVSIGDVEAPIVVGSNSYMVVRVPEGASAGELVVSATEDARSNSWACDIGVQVVDNLHPVANPAVDRQGNIYSTFSGARGQKTPVAVYKIDLNYTPKPFVSDMMNATGLAFDREGILYVSSRHDGIVYQVTPNGTLSVYVEGMGVATGLAFDHDENLYVGDRSGTIFKISRSRQIYVFTTLEPSIAAYHLAFGPDGNLYITGPTTSSYDCVYRCSPHGEVEVFYRGLGRPQGLAFDTDGNLYVAGSRGGRRGVVRIDADRNAKLFLSGPGIVGQAFSPSRSMIVATNNALFRVDANIEGFRVF